MLPGSTENYLRRYVDNDIDGLLPGLRALSIDGAKGVGKTETASRRVTDSYRLDIDSERNFFEAAAEKILQSAADILIDEWQRYPASWDLARRAVDGKRKGLIVLTGSATPQSGVDTHSGAARITSIQMRPLALSERRITTPQVFIKDLWENNEIDFYETEYDLQTYANEICASGFPGINELPNRNQRRELRSYVDRIIDRELPELGINVRKPQTLRSWLASYAAVTATTTSYTEILDAATSGESNKPSKSSTQVYRDLLEKIWVLDELPAWTPTFAPRRRLTTASKHYLIDPAISALLMGVTPQTLLDARSGGMKAFGQLFEALAVLTVRSAGAACEATAYHFRTQNGSQEIDVLLEDYFGNLIAFEIKLKPHVDSNDVRHLHAFEKLVGEKLKAKVMVTTGSRAYKRTDGVLVVPLALLG